MKRIIALMSIISGLALLSANPISPKAEFGWKMLTIPVAPSVSAMAGTGSFASTEATAFIQNPTAGIVNNINSLSGTQQYWLFDTNLNSLAISSSSSLNAYGFALRALDYGQIDSRDITGEIIGEFHPLDLNLIFNYARRVSPNLYTGINLMLLYQKIESASSTGIAADLGITYLTPKRGLDIHLAMKHIGFTTEVRNERIKLPYSPEVGMSYEIALQTTDLYFETTVTKHPDDDLMLRTGVSATLMNSLSFRLGYLLNSDLQDFTAGIGIGWRHFGFDYAYLPFKEEISDAHSMGITYRF